MAKKNYVIVSAPSTEILEMLVEGYISDGLTPIGSITIDTTGLSPAYLQPMYRMPKPQVDTPPEDWTQGMTKVSL